VLARLEAFCQGARSAAACSHAGGHEAVTPMGAIGSLLTCRPEVGRQEPSQGTLPYPTPLQAGEGAGT
jgi:hypothetical protein